MNRITYNKLVRDRIPEIIEKTGKPYKVSQMSNQEFQDALKNKLLEEAKEVNDAISQKDLIKEIADVYEVIDALLLSFEINRNEVLKMQKTRNQNRGGFTEKIKLLWVDEPD